MRAHHLAERGDVPCSPGRRAFIIPADDRIARKYMNGIRKMMERRTIQFRDWTWLALAACLCLVHCGTEVRAQENSPRPPADQDSPPATTEVDEADAAGPTHAPRRQASAADDPPAPSTGPRAVIVEPSQGRPIFITPGETFYFVMRLRPGVFGDVGFSLRHALEPTVRVPLKPATPPSYADEYCTLVLLVPLGVHPGLYDIEVGTDAGAHTARHSVRVVDQFKDKFRFIHLSNMNVGDPTAAFDDMIPREVNLLAPEFIIATGDYTEWARARDDAASWQRVLDYFARFSAPVFMLCGAHDHEASFLNLVGKIVDAFDYGMYHGLLLLDHAGNPIEQDYSQIQWVDADLRKNRQKRFNFIATNSDELGLLDIWRERGGADEFIREHKIKLLLVGGSSDWDYREFAHKLDGLGGLSVVRTHQSSTSLRDKATGVGHYRVIDVDGDRVSFVYPDDNATEKLQHSVPTGRLRTFFDGPNDGSGSKVAVTVQNSLNQGFDDARLWLRVAKGSGSDAVPTVAPGRLVQAIDAGAFWACDVAIDLPDKGAVRVMAAAHSDAIPPALPIKVELGGTRQWSFAPKTTEFGLDYFECADRPTLKLTNLSGSKLTCWPVIRVNGQQIYADAAEFPRLPLPLEPNAPLELPLVLQLRRVSTGSHDVQVHFLADPLSRLHTFDVALSTDSSMARAGDASP
jgi:hypothetical protein